MGMGDVRRGGEVERLDTGAGQAPRGSRSPSAPAEATLWPVALRTVQRRRRLCPVAGGAAGKSRVC